MLSTVGILRVRLRRRTVDGHVLFHELLRPHKALICYIACTYSWNLNPKHSEKNKPATTIPRQKWLNPPKPLLYLTTSLPLFPFKRLSCSSRSSLQVPLGAFSGLSTLKQLSFTGASQELCEALTMAVGLEKDREPWENRLFFHVFSLVCWADLVITVLYRVCSLISFC